MKNKVLVELIVPEIDKTYDIFIPINKSIGEVTALLIKAVVELSDGIYSGGKSCFLYDKETGQKFDLNILVYDTKIRNGTTLVLL